MPDFSGRVKKNPILYPLDPKPWLKSPGLKSSWLKSLELKLGVDKSRVEMSFNQKDPPLNNTCNQRFTTKGWTETAIMLCKLNKSL